jgi:hypothetical protein
MFKSRMGILIVMIALAALVVLPASASVNTDFESEAANTFANALGIAGVTFQGTDWFISPCPPDTYLQNNCLADPSSPVANLTADFDSPQMNVSFGFGVIDFAETGTITSVTVQGYLGGSLVTTRTFVGTQSSVAPTIWQGQANLGATGVDRIVIIPQTGADQAAIDNLSSVDYAPTEGAPGCDAQITIPSSAVGAKITADTLAYWTPGEATDTTLTAGTSVRAISHKDGYYQILFVCDFLYVPDGTIGPNPEAPWYGAPLP